MKYLNIKWLFIALVACFILMGIIQVNLYHTSFTRYHFINAAFLSGLIFFCFGGLFFIIQSGVFDVPVNAIKMFWKTVTKLGQWIRDNEFEEDTVLYDYNKRKRRHPLALSCALVGLLFCLVTLALSY